MFSKRSFCLQFSVLLFVLQSHPAWSQGTIADYERALALRGRYERTLFRNKVNPHWSSDGERFGYKVETGRNQHEFIIVDAKRGQRELAFDHKELAELLSKELGKPVDELNLPIERIEFAENAIAGEVHFISQGKHWKFDQSAGELLNVESAIGSNTNSTSEKNQQRRNSQTVSPDGLLRATIEQHSLLIKNEMGDESPTEIRIAGSKEHAFTTHNLAWAPDSKKLVVWKVEAGEQRTVHFIESSPKDQLQPKLHAFNYLKPGDRIPQPRLHLIDIESNAEIVIDDSHFKTPWLNNPKIHWSPDSSRFYFVYNQRGHQVLRVISIDAKTGDAQVIVNEESKTFVDYAYKQYLHFLHETNELIWMSERDGWNHLYLYDSLTGEVKNQITQGPWVVRKVVHVNEEQRQLWFECSGLLPEQNPYNIQLARIEFDGTNLTRLTDGDGTHTVKFSPDRRYLIDSYSRIDSPPLINLRETATGKLVCKLEESDITKLKTAGWSPPERFVSKGRDGKTDIHGVIFRPSNFDPEQKYPVIEKIYAGPHGSFVPISFREFHSAQEVAEVGFIVVQIDGMGTSNRSKAFHDVCWKNLGDSGFPDRIQWIKAAARQFPEFDLTHGVGIYGGSAGGQNALRALLAQGDFYTVAVSDCGCHDNRMDKIWWNELWMSWPIGPHYAEQSNVTQAHKLTGKLFLTVGEKDTNVDPASTMQVVNALIKAGKDFDFIMVPGHGHGVGEIPYLRKRRIDFFVRHLMKKEPRVE